MPPFHSSVASGSVANRDENDERSLANSAGDNHGKSRAQVLESGGRVDKGTGKPGAWTEPTTADVNLRTALAVLTGADSGGLKLSSGKASNPGCRGDEAPGIPVRER
jgi:hypothetical protein